MANISFLVLLVNESVIFSPTFLTDIVSPSDNNLISDVAVNLDKTPVSLSSTFLVKSPFSYP